MLRLDLFFYFVAKDVFQTQFHHFAVRLERLQVQAFFRPDEPHGPFFIGKPVGVKFLDVLYGNIVHRIVDVAAHIVVQPQSQCALVAEKDARFGNAARFNDLLDGLTDYRP